GPQLERGRLAVLALAVPEQHLLFACVARQRVAGPLVKNSPHVRGGLSIRKERVIGRTRRGRIIVNWRNFCDLVRWIGRPEDSRWLPAAAEHQCSVIDIEKPRV